MDTEEKRKRMVEVIEQEVAYTSSYIGKTKLDSRVMAVMGKVPRHEFVPSSLQSMAYNNGPLSIGDGQTISQPYIVALMTDLLEPEPDDVILEVGTGSGYQAAILSELVKQVHTTEDVPPLATSAKERLQRLGYDNVEVYEQDGYFGLPDKAPFDGIIVTAAAPHIPMPLIEQLKPGACLVIPVGPEFHAQILKVIQKQEDGNITQKNVLDVIFVPMTGKDHNLPAEDLIQGNY